MTDDEADFWADHTRARDLTPATTILDPLQTDDDHPVIRVQNVSHPDQEGMVTITGHCPDCLYPAQVRVSGDWPVQLWTAELAEHTRLSGTERTS